jgi:hypothetical protein
MSLEARQPLGRIFSGRTVGGLEQTDSDYERVGLRPGNFQRARDPLRVLSRS